MQEWMMGVTGRSASNVFIRDEEWKSEKMTRGTGQDQMGGAGSLVPTGQLMQ
jgi:hypothetical protein